MDALLFIVIAPATHQHWQQMRIDLNSNNTPTVLLSFVVFWDGLGVSVRLDRGVCGFWEFLGDSIVIAPAMHRHRQQPEIKTLRSYNSRSGFGRGLCGFWKFLGDGIYRDSTSNASALATAGNQNSQVTIPDLVLMGLGVVLSGNRISRQQ